MTDPHLKISISGLPGSGKTTVLKVLSNLLEAHGIEVVAVDLGDEDAPLVGTLAQRLVALKRRGLRVKIITLPLRAPVTGMTSLPLENKP